MPIKNRHSSINYPVAREHENKRQMSRERKFKALKFQYNTCILEYNPLLQENIKTKRNKTIVENREKNIQCLSFRRNFFFTSICYQTVNIAHKMINNDCCKKREHTDVGLHKVTGMLFEILNRAHFV
ncbi:hypothetical protein V8G54_015656, partial [Vigna mungo]